MLAFAPGDNIDDFVRLHQDGADVTVQVDITGPSDGANFVNVAVLAGYGSSNPDFVRVVFENQASAEYLASERANEMKEGLLA